MTRSFLYLTLATSAVFARHAHARPQHEHLAPRQNIGAGAGGGASGLVNAAPAPVAQGAGPAAVPGTGSLPGAAPAAVPNTGSLPGAAPAAVPNSGSLPGAAAANPQAIPVGQGGIGQIAPGPGALPTSPSIATGIPQAPGPVVIPTPSVAASALTPPSVPAAVPTSAVLGDVSALSNDLDSCLARIPQEVIAIVQAVEARLGAVQSQLSNLGSLVSSALPNPPAVSTPGVPPIATPSLPPVASPSLPSISTPAISISSPALPSIATPSLPTIASPSLPSISTPAAPSISAPSVAASVLPSIATPSLPSVSAAVPSATLPSVTPPPIATTFSLVTPSGLPTAASIPASLPAAVSSAGGVLVAQDPGLCAPANGLGPLTPCSPSLPATRAPSVSVPSAALPTGLAAAPAVPTTPVSTPNITISSTFVSLSPKFSFAPTALDAAIVPNPPALTITTMTDFAPIKPVSTPSTYVFNANARDNLAVYYGSTSTNVGGLANLCTQKSVDIVILSFLYDFFSANGYPSIDFGWSSCSASTPLQAAVAPGLKDCSTLATEIQTCQSLGKKVLLSLGGYIANSSFTSDLEARNFAVTLWNFFGAGTSDLRPFGSVIIDGFDLDNENGDSDHWDIFAASLRALFNSDTSKTYYLSAAPQCIYPDASIPMYALQHADFVWVQFYNNPSCNLDSSGFQSSFRRWSNALKNSTLPSNPRLYIGAPASAAGGSGYVPNSGLSSRISLARELFVKNLGGMMLWDGATALANVDKNHNNYMQYAKWALEY